MNTCDVFKKCLKKCETLQNFTVVLFYVHSTILFYPLRGKSLSTTTNCMLTRNKAKLSILVSRIQRITYLLFDKPKLNSKKSNFHHFKSTLFTGYKIT